MATTSGETQGSAEAGHASALAGGKAEGARKRAHVGHAPADAQLDMLTAALIGLAVGVSATLLLRRGPRGVRPIAPVMRAAARGAQWARERGEDVLEHIPRAKIADEVEDYARAAREAIDRAVRKELRTFRHTLREQARRATR